MAPTNEVEINTNGKIYSIMFTDGGEQVLGGGTTGTLRRWQVDSGHEASIAIQDRSESGATTIFTAALSLDRKWLVCGLRNAQQDPGVHVVRVWDAQTQERVFGVNGRRSVAAVDISTDSAKFVTGSCDGQVFVRSLPLGKKLLGPLALQGKVVAVRFSPDGDRIATASESGSATGPGSIRLFSSNNGHQLLYIPFDLHGIFSSPLAWSANGRQFFAVSHGKLKRFDASSGSLVSQWSVPSSQRTASIVLSSNERFAAVVADDSLSFWDIHTARQIRDAIKHSSAIYSVSLSPYNDCIATGEDSGRVTLRNLRPILPVSCFSTHAQLPFASIDDATFDAWTRGDLMRVEELLTEEVTDPSRHACALACRALVRSRLKEWDAAIDDAKKSAQLEQSVIGYIANAVATVGNGKCESAMDEFDCVFSVCPQSEITPLLLIKAVIFFECGKQDSAISRVNQLIRVAEDKPLYLAVQAQMFLITGGILLDKGDVEQAIASFRRARDAIPLHSGPHLTLISLIFGWDFDKFDDTTEMKLQQCAKRVEDLGDAVVNAGKLEDAIRDYSTALSLGPSNPAGLLVKRSKVYASLESWEGALTDADEAVKVDPASPWACEARYVALCGLGRFFDAANAFTCMFSFVEGSADEDVRQLAKKYLPLWASVSKIDDAIGEVTKTSPLVLIDVKSGRLCDSLERTISFKSESEFRELLSLMIQKLDEEQIRQVVERYFEYVALSHVWEGMEPLIQDVNAAGSVWELDSVSPLNDKLKKFCEVVRADGYRWAWSDTCCIDKTISTVLNQSLRMMYLWYESCAATFVFLWDVELPSDFLKDSKWLTRAWTSLELLSPKVIRFYTRDWTPYRGDVRRNHKESPEIMQELADAIGVASETIISFNPDALRVRERLRLASMRNSTREEDITYSLIGIFKSDIRPHYGEGYVALGHLLEEIVTRSGEMTILDWTGKSSRYNSCLPVSLSVYSHPPGPSPALSNTEMNMQVAEIANSLSRTDVLWLHEQITSLQPARFANRRLYLPCIVFGVRKLGVQNLTHGREFRYRARTWGIGDVDFYTSDKLSQAEPRKLVFVHPWIRDLCDPSDGFDWGSATDDEDGNGDFNADESAPSSPLHGIPTAPVDEYTQALRLVARLQQPFRALLLQQQPSGEFMRVATEHEIVVPGIRRGLNFSKDVRVSVVEIS